MVCPSIEWHDRIVSHAAETMAYFFNNPDRTMKECSNSLGWDYAQDVFNALRGLDMLDESGGRFRVGKKYAPPSAYNLRHNYIRVIGSTLERMRPRDYARTMGIRRRSSSYILRKLKARRPK